MFNLALFWIEDFDNRHTICVGQGEVYLFSEVSSESWCRTSRAALEVRLAEVNSYSDSFADSVRLPASRQPCFG